MKAIILCAGRGTRLQPLTDTVPKPLLQVKDKSILEHILDNLPEKITEVFLVVNYLSKKIENFSQSINDNYQFTIECINQLPEKKGTMAALLSVRDKLQTGEKFLVLNGDDLIQKKDLEKMFLYDRSFAVQHMVMPNYYKIVTENGILKGFENQTEIEKQIGVPIATGAYLIDTQIFDFPVRLLKGDEIGIPQTIMDNKTDYPVHTVEFSSWRPINTVSDLENVNSTN